MPRPILHTRRWNRVEYERLVDIGIFGPGERLELLDGVLLVREPQNPAHATAIQAVQDALRRVFGPGWDVRPQLPVALDDVSEPEPDAAVVRGSYRDYRAAHPSRPVLVVEVGDLTLAIDRRKAGLYARAGVEEYWIVDLLEEVLEVRRTPTVSPESRFGWTYAQVRTLRRGESVTPLAAPGQLIAVDDLLP